MCYLFILTTLGGSISPILQAGRLRFKRFGDLTGVTWQEIDKGRTRSEAEEGIFWGRKFQNGEGSLFKGSGGEG